jgi:hypothetical protein
VVRGDPSLEEPRAASWLRSLLLPALVFIVAVAVVSGLVFGGVIHGDKTYAGPGEAPTTPPTVLIEPRVGEPQPVRRTKAPVQ